MRKLPTILIRTDASVEIGTGHLMRMLALAQAYLDVGGSVAIVSRPLPEALIERLQAEQLEPFIMSEHPGSLQDARFTTDLAARWDAEWIILDGYLFNAHYQQLIKRSGFKLLVVDDYGHLDHYYADIILNQNLHANEIDYPHEPYTRLLLGNKYALLRREFLSWSTWDRRIGSTAKRILVLSGGVDKQNATMRILAAVDGLSTPLDEVTTIVGAGYRYRDSLEKFVKTLNQPIRLLSSVKNIPKMMATSDLAISAAGSTSWELAFMGLPSLLYAVAENQRGIQQSLSQFGAAINLGWFASLTADSVRQHVFRLVHSQSMRQRMSKIARTLIDGLGALRVIENMLYNDSRRKL